MMKQDIKNKEFRENQEYVSPSVKVIEVAAQRVVCTSGGTEDSQEGDTTNWWTN